MAAETKTVTLRLPVELHNYLLKAEDASINQAVVNVIRKVIALEQVSSNDLRGIFTPQEWIFFVDSLNGTMVTDSFRYSKDALKYHNEDAEQYESKATSNSVSVAEINAKVDKLSGAQVEALYRRVERYWENHATLELQEWANF